MNDEPRFKNPWKASVNFSRNKDGLPGKALANAVPNNTGDFYIYSNGSIETVVTSIGINRFFVLKNPIIGEFNLFSQLVPNKFGYVKFPNQGIGFERYSNEDTGGLSENPNEVVGHGDHYLLPITAACLIGLIYNLHVHNGFLISLGDMSSSNGSDPWQKGGKHHAGHGHLGRRSGMDVDFRYLNLDGKSFQSVNAFTNSAYSKENNQIVFDTGKKFGFTKNFQGISGNLNGPLKVDGHNDHGHLGLVFEDVRWKYISKAHQTKLIL